MLAVKLLTFKIDIFNYMEEPESLDEDQDKRIRAASNSQDEEDAQHLEDMAGGGVREEKKEPNFNTDRL